MVKHRLRKGINRFWELLDAELVGPFQAVVYLHMAAAGIYGLAVAGGAPQAVEDSMGHVYNALWLWLLPGVIVCLIGKLLRGDLTYAGMIFQLTGDTAAFGGLFIYFVATINTSWWGKALFAVFLVAALAECVILLIVRDVRRLYRVERRVRS